MASCAKNRRCPVQKHKQEYRNLWQTAYEAFFLIEPYPPDANSRNKRKFFPGAKYNAVNAIL